MNYTVMRRIENLETNKLSRYLALLKINKNNNSPRDDPVVQKALLKVKDKRDIIAGVVSNSVWKRCLDTRQHSTTN
jgi:heme-binding NEAT domain protein